MHRHLILGTGILLAAGLLVGPQAYAAPPAPAPSNVSVRSAPDYPDTLAIAERYVRQQRKASGSTSITVGLVQGDHIAWTLVDGRGSVSGGKPTAAQAYGIGSVSKMFAAVAVMQLVDAGKVNLDTPVVHYVPDFRMADPAYRQITVRMLLNHSAGLPGSSYFNGMTTAPVPEYADQVLRSWRDQRLKTTPGSMSVYCNDCFTLAGIVVQEVSGTPYTQYVADHILTPLDMRHSYFATTPVVPGTYAPVIVDGNELPYQYTNIYASGGLMSTSQDMLHFASMLLNGGMYAGNRILSASAVQQMAVNQVPGTLDPVMTSLTQYGLGWDTVRQGALDNVGVLGWSKNGSVVTYHSDFIVAPDQDLGVIVIAASLNAASVGKIAEKVMLRALLEKGAIGAIPPVITSMGPSAATPPSGLLSRMAGIYLASDGAIKVKATTAGAVKYGKLVNGKWAFGDARYTYRTDGCFWSTVSAGVCVRLGQGWSRRYLVLTTPTGVGNYTISIARAEKMSPDIDLPELWQQRMSQRYLIASSMPYETAWSELQPLVLSPVPELSGYFLLDPMGTPFHAGDSPTVASMPVVVPANFGRDLEDLVAVDDTVDAWLAYGNMLLRPLGTVPALARGTSSVSFDGTADWRRIQDAGVLSLAGPLEAWFLYGPDFGMPLAQGTGEARGVEVPAGGGYLVAMGPRGGAAGVTLN